MTTSVTLTVYHYVTPANHQAYEEWLANIIQVAASFPGHEGVNIVTPGAGGQRYRIGVRFKDEAAATTWRESHQRESLLTEIRPLMSRPEQVELASGLENWFRTDALDVARPTRWKQWLLTTLVIWGLTMAVPLLMVPLFQHLPWLNVFGVRHALMAAVIVALVIYVIMPRLARWLSSWLHR